MDEVDQHRDRAQRQQQPGQDCYLRHELALVAATDRPQHHQAIDEGRDEGAERHLVAAIAHEIGQDPRPVLAGRVGDGDDGDREDDAGDGDHRAGDRRQHQVSAVRLCLLVPAEPVEPAGRGPGIEPHYQRSKDDGGKRHQAGHEPVARAQPLDQPEKVGAHNQRTLCKWIWCRVGGRSPSVQSRGRSTPSEHPESQLREDEDGGHPGPDELEYPQVGLTALRRRKWAPAQAPVGDLPSAALVAVGQRFSGPPRRCAGNRAGSCGHNRPTSSAARRGRSSAPSWLESPPW